MRPLPLRRAAGIALCLLAMAAPAFGQKDPPAKDADALPEGAVARYGSRRMRHDSLANAVAFSADSKTLASAGADGTVRLWEVSTGKEVRTFTIPGEQMLSVLFFKDGKTLAAAGMTGTIHLLDAETGNEKHALKGHVAGAVNVALSGDEKKLFSCGRDGTVREWDVENAKETRLLGRNARAPSKLALSADGKTLAVVVLDGVKLYDAEAGKELRQLNLNKTQIEAVAFTPDGKSLAVGFLNNTLALHDVETGKEGQTFRVPSGQLNSVQSVAFSPSGKVLATCGVQGVCLWGVTSGKEIRRLDSAARGGMHIAYSPDGTLVAVAERDGAARLWNVETGKELHDSGGFAGAVQQIRFLADGKTIAASAVDPAQQGFRVFDAATGKEAGTLRGLATNLPGSWGIGADGKTILSFGQDRILRWLDPLTGREMRRLDSALPAALPGAVAADGRTVGMLLANRALQLFDTETGAEIQRFSAAPNLFLGTALVLSSDGQRVIATAAGPVHLWDVHSGAELWKGDVIDRPSSQVAFAPDGKTLAYRVGNQVRVVEVVSRQERLHLERPPGVLPALTPPAAQSLAFSPDGRVLAIGTSQSVVVLYDVPTGKELGSFKGHRGGVYAAGLLARQRAAGLRRRRRHRGRLGRRQSRQEEPPGDRGPQRSRTRVAMAGPGRRRRQGPPAALVADRGTRQGRGGAEGQAQSRARGGPKTDRQTHQRLGR